MFDFINTIDPEVMAVIYLVAGAVLGLVAKPVFVKLKAKVAKTETKVDDELVAKAEELVQKAIANLKAKGAVVEAAPEAVEKESK